MKYAPLVLKHLRKNWIRTLSTVLAMAVCIFLICTLQTVVDAVNYGLHLGNASRLVTRHYVSLVFNLPNSYKAKIAAIPGVENTTIINWFGGVYRDPKNFFANLAVEPEPSCRFTPRSCCRKTRSRHGFTMDEAALSAGSWRKNWDGRSATISSWRASFLPTA